MMASFNEANQVKLALKMMLHFYSWFNNIAVISEDNGYGVMVTVSRMDDKIRKIIPQIRNGVPVKVNVLSR